MSTKGEKELALALKSLCLCVVQGICQDRFWPAMLVQCLCFYL